MKSGDPRISRRCTAPRLFDPSESSVRALLSFLHARHPYPLHCAAGPVEAGPVGTGLQELGRRSGTHNSCGLRGRVLSWDGGGAHGEGQVRVRGPPRPFELRRGELSGPAGDRLRPVDFCVLWCCFVLGHCSTSSILRIPNIGSSLMHYTSPFHGLNSYIRCLHA